MIAPALAETIPESLADRNLLSVCWRQHRAESSLRRRGIAFRTTDPAAARSAYAAMTPEEFAAVNGRQAWANRRTIARSLRGLLPDRPVVAIDLGCGIGESTAVLASLLPAGSRVVGIEFAGPLVEVASGRTFRGPDGRPADVSFVAGSVTETYRDESGTPFAEGSADLVNASGIVGHHLSPFDAERAAAEITRVLRPGGLAALDPGPRQPRAALRELMTRRGLAFLRSTRSNPFDRTGQLVFRKPG